MEPKAGCSKHNNIFADRDNLPTHESGGARRALPGFFYQFQLLMVWILQAVTSSLKFYISTEDDKLGKFDDFGFYKIVNGEEIRTFIQVKSKQNEDCKLTFKDFFSKQINLVQYFESYFGHILKNDPDADSENTKLILYTNCGLEFGSEYKNIILKEEMFEKVPYDELFKADLLKFRTEFEGKDDFVKLFIHNSKCAKSDVENFLSKFYIVLNGENMSDLEHKIKQHLEMFVSKNNIEKCYYQYYSNFQDWYKSKKGTKIDSDSILRYFQIMKDKITQKLHFNLLSPNINFYGRSEELKNMENNLNSDEKSKLIDIAITGTAGVGKSELARKCAQNLNDKFQHILWLNAESKDTLNSNFIELAKYLGISVNKKENINSAIRNVYDYLRDRKCLFIFDNAESYFTSDFSEYILTLNKNHKVILTSQKQDWPSSLDIEIEEFLEKDAVQFLSENLNCDDKNSELLTEIVVMLSCLPLALQLAVAYIENMMKRKILLSKKYKLQDFYEDLTCSKNQFLSFKFSDTKVFDNYKKSIYLSWQLALNSLASEVNGDKAIEILQIMSYLQADNIPIKLFFTLCNENMLEDVIYLLKSYSLIKCEAEKCSIHRLLQDVIRTKLGENEQNNSQDILDKAIDCIFTCEFENISENIDHLFNIWNYIKNDETLKQKCFDYDSFNYWSVSFRWVNENPELCYEILKCKLLCPNFVLKTNFVDEKYDTLHTISHIAKKLLNCTEIISLFQEHFNFEDHSLVREYDTFLDVLSSFSYFYYKTNEYNKSLSLFDKLLLNNKLENNFDFLCRVYEKKIISLTWQHKYEEALSTVNEIKPVSEIEKGHENYGYFELYTEDIQVMLINLLYVVEGPKKCIETVHILLNTINSKNVTLKIIILLWLTKFYLRQENLKCIIDLFTKVFSFLLDDTNEPKVEIFNLCYLLNNISGDLVCSFKPGSLTNLCDKIDCFLATCKIDDWYKVKLEFSLVDLLIKNLNYTKAMHKLIEMNLKYKNQYEESTRDNYRKSLCSIAMLYHLQGETEQALDMIEVNLGDNQTDHPLINMLITTKANILLLVNPDEAIEYLKLIISVMKNKYPLNTELLFNFEYNLIEFLISQGKYKQALEKLEKLSENLPKDSLQYKLCCKNMIDILELKYNYTEFFFNFLEKFILEKGYYSICTLYTHYLEKYKTIKDPKFANLILKDLETESDNFDNYFCTNRARNNLLFGEFSSYLDAKLTLAYFYYILKDYKNSLKIIHELKQSKLLFLENTLNNYIQDFNRFEKLIKFRLKQKEH